MTKEELKQEAEELYKDWYAHKLGAISITDVICKMAEPREKRIAELEAQIEKMKVCQNCDNWNWKHSKCEKKLKGDCFKQSKWILRR